MWSCDPTTFGGKNADCEHTHSRKQGFGAIRSIEHLFAYIQLRMLVRLCAQKTHRLHHCIARPLGYAQICLMSNVSHMVPCKLMCCIVLHLNPLRPDVPKCLDEAKMTTVILQLVCVSYHVHIAASSNVHLHYTVQCGISLSGLCRCRWRCVLWCICRSNPLHYRQKPSCDWR